MTLYGFEGRTAATTNGSKRGGGIAFADDTKVGSDKGEDLSRAGLERAIALGGGLDNTMTARTGYGETMRDAHTAYQLLLDAKHYKQRSEELFGSAASNANGIPAGGRSGWCARAFRRKGVVVIMCCLALTICTQSNCVMGRLGIEDGVLVRVREGLGIGNVTLGANGALSSLQSMFGGKESTEKRSSRRGARL